MPDAAARPDGRTTVVVIPRDRRPELLRTLRTLRDLPERPAVIVTDNGSRDGTAEAVRGEPAAGAALRGFLARLPAALRHRTPLPDRVEQAARLLDGRNP